MPIQLTDRLAYPNRGTVSRAFAYGLAQGAKRQDFLMAYLSELYRLCAKYNLDFSILVAQSANETDAWRSQIWLLYGNPAGIGVTGTDTSAGTNYSLIYKSGKDAARAHVVHMFAYVRGAITAATGELNDYVKLDPRYNAVMTGKDLIHKKQLAGSVVTIESFNTNGRWAELYKPPPYGVRIVNSGTDVWGNDLPDQGDPPVTTPATPEIPVEGEPVSQVSLPIKQKMIPASNYNRPGDKLNNAPLWITIHETDNWSVGADAEMHALFVCNGGGSENVSFHGTVDDHEAYQMLPADEVGWHAGDGCNDRSTDIGCFQSFAIETCVNGDGNWSQTKKNLVDFVAAIITGDPRINFAGRQGQFSVDRIAQHNKWSGKNCPSTIRAEGSWNTLLGQIKARVAQLQGGTTPAPTYAKPDKPPAGTHTKNDRTFLGVTEEYTLTKDTTPYQYADFKNPTGPVLKKGAKVKVTHVVSDTGASADLVLVIEDGSRIDGKAVA